MIKQLGISHSNAAEIHFNGPQLHKFSRSSTVEVQLYTLNRLVLSRSTAAEIQCHGAQTPAPPAQTPAPPASLKFKAELENDWPVIFQFLL